LALLEVKDLVVEFSLPEGKIRAPDGISFEVEREEVLGIVGESGSGKSATALAIMGLVPSPPGRVVSGKILFEGKDVSRNIHELRGKEISMVFQNPLNSLNPSLKIGVQLMEVLQEHLNMNEKEAWNRSVGVLKMMGIPDPETMMNRYPFEFSGGMRQRVMIAMAMLCEPKLLIADEPTTALDVTIQAQILKLFRKLKESSKASIIFISHDLSVIAQIADRVVVMYAGKIVEKAKINDIFEHPLHPYTKGLLKSIPSFYKKRKSRFHSIPGNVPNLMNPPKGCRFHPRCSDALTLCQEKEPPFFKVNGSYVSCWLYRRGADPA